MTRIYRDTNMFKKEVFDLVGDEYTVLGEYISLKESIKMKHNKCNNEWDTNTGWFLKGTRCPKCQHGSYKKTTEEFKKEVFDLVGDEYTVLGEYIGTNIKISMKHNKCNNVYEIKPNSFLNSGHRCPKCYGINNKITDGFFNNKINYTLENGEYTVLEYYTKNNILINIRHNKCNNIFQMKPNDFQQGHRCPFCSHIGPSLLELELLEYIKEIYNGEIITSNRTLLKGKEIDIYLPEFNIGIEFDGLYFHSDKFKNKDYHLNKTNDCKEQDIYLIHIFEDEWVNKKDIVKNKLKSILHKTENKIYARKCYIEEVSVSDKNKFLNSNHIQGTDKSSIKLGLWYKLNQNEDILVAVMTFCKPRVSLGQKNNLKYDYELSRYATENKYSVVGGFSKLLKYFERNYEWKKILTYADKRYSKGNVYIKNGFNFIHDSKPNYWYFNTIFRYHRYSFRKQELKKKFPEIYDDNLTEFEIMNKANYYKIYDCGNMVFCYEKKKERT